MKGQGNREGQIENGFEQVDLLETNKEGGVEQSEKSEEGSEENTPEETPESFHAIAALSATWLPCVVGEQEQKLFLVSGVTSLLFKVLLLLLAVTLAGSGLQPHIYERPFLLFCFDQHSPVLNKTGITPCKYSEDQCRPPTNLTNKARIFKALSAVEMAVLQYKRILTDINDDNLEKLNVASDFLSHVITSKAEIHEALESAGIWKMQQRIRICEENETPFRLCLLAGLLVVILLASYATYRLHRIADYQELFNSSKTVMGCIPCPQFRVIHRSLMFEAIKLSLFFKDQKLLKKILEALQAKRETKSSSDESKKEEAEDRISRDEDAIENGSRETEQAESEAVSNIVASLSRLEQSHMEHNKVLLSANKLLNRQDVTKVCKMEEKIRGIKESLGREDKEGKGESRFRTASFLASAASHSSCCCCCFSRGPPPEPRRVVLRFLPE